MSEATNNQTTRPDARICRCGLCRRDRRVQQGGEAASHGAHNSEVAGSSPAPAIDPHETPGAAVAARPGILSEPSGRPAEQGRSAGALDDAPRDYSNFNRLAETLKSIRRREGEEGGNGGRLAPGPDDVPLVSLGQGDYVRNYTPTL